MPDQPTAYAGATIFDGTSSFNNQVLLVNDGRFAGIVGVGDIPENATLHSLDGGTLAPGYVDLQVNGGGGILFNDEQSVAALRKIAHAHAGLGATSILPTLITDTPATTMAAIEAVCRAIDEKVAGIVGLHLEGPHLSTARKGAHDPALIRPMTPADLDLLKEAAARLPVLKVTVAPESVSADQVRVLADAGAIVSIGHTDASFDSCLQIAESGASCVTHLFNAMSQLGNREPGLVGAAIAVGELNAGLIADGIHVHPRTMGIALRAKKGPGRIFLVSDAMATAGSTIDHFVLNGRRIERSGGRLTLQDGTLAGADLELTAAIKVLTSKVGIALHEALAMATSIPATVIGCQSEIGSITADRRADFIWLDAAGNLEKIWRRGELIGRQEQ